MKSPIKKALLLSLVGTTLTACFEEEATKSEVVRPITWMQVGAEALSQTRTLSGIVEAAEKAELSFEVGGKIKSVTAKLGDTVKKGDILAELDEDSYTLNNLSAKAELQKARSQLVEAQNEFNRQAKLFKDGWIAQAKYDDAKAGLDTAKSAVEIAQADLKLRTKDLDDTILRAPYDGVISARLIEPSQQVNAGQTCFEVEGEKGLEISVLVPENLLKSLDRSKEYSATFPALDQAKGTVTISEIGAQAEAANAFPVTLQVQTNQDISDLRAGMSAEVDFEFAGKGIKTGFSGDSIRLPHTALMTGENDKVYAFVYNEDTQQVAKREVLPENIFNNEVIVTQGLEPGEIIATAGLDYLYDGQKVRLMDDGSKIFNE